MEKKIENREYLYRVLALVYNHARRVAVIEYPRDIERRSVDVAVELKDGKKMLLKVAWDLDSVTKREASELSVISSTLNVPTLIISETQGSVRLVSGVIYEKSNVRVVNAETLESYLSEREGPVIYQERDSFKLSIDGGKLKEKRIEKGLSLGDVALSVGVTRKAVYEYERGLMEPTIDKGEKLVQLLGEDILKPLNLLELAPRSQGQASPSRFDSDIERKAANLLEQEGYRVFHAKRTVSDIGGAKRESSLLLAVKHRKESIEGLLEKSIYLERLSKVIGSEAATLVEDSGIARALSSEGITVYTMEDIVSLVRSLERRE
ncbi:MAG: helix-turn-helix domain-containing protein [Desulfurococcales archaeon]|nr:helix-turn-helix domain-containing protein [Desulfurococcales archaeon]